jgi:hypothetical protein
MKRALVVLSAVCVACSDATVPSIAAVDVVDWTLGTDVPLSAVLEVVAPGTDSLRVRTWIPSQPSADARWISLHDGSLTVLGLRPATQYRIVADRGSEETASDTVRVTTPGLPSDLASFTLSINGTFTGLLLTALPGDHVPYAVVFDSTGTIVWYRPFPAFSDNLVGEIKQQFNGNFTIYIGNSFGWQPTFGRYLEFTAQGAVVREHTAPAPLYTDNHELLLTPREAGDVTAHFFSYDIRRTDLTPIGGRADALVAGHQIVRSRGGLTEYFWNGWDHLLLTDWIDEPQSQKQQANIDFDHPNSLAIAPDGNYLVSMRHFGQVLKINYNTGAVMWRLGGQRSDFSIQDDPLAFFSGQHSASILPNGNLLLYDNGNRHMPPLTRVVEYSVNETTKIARMVWEYRPSPAIFTPFVGFVERLQNGNTFVAFANADRLLEVTPDKTVVWQGTLTRNGAAYGNAYRFRRIPSLYRYDKP